MYLQDIFQLIIACTDILFLYFIKIVIGNVCNECRASLFVFPPPPRHDRMTTERVEFALRSFFLFRERKIYFITSKFINSKNHLIGRKIKLLITCKMAY